MGNVVGTNQIARMLTVGTELRGHCFRKLLQKLRNSHTSPKTTGKSTLHTGTRKVTEVRDYDPE